MLLDNLSSHKTPKVINFFIDNKINIVFNCPYRSEFNCIELAFSHIKRNIYTKIYERMEEIEKDIIKIINDSSLEKALMKNYCETLEIYEYYSLNNKFADLNNL